METNNISEVARKFKVQRSSMDDIARQDGWRARRDKIIELSQASVDRKLTKVIRKVTTQASQLQQAIYDRLIHENGLNEDVDASIADFERITRLLMKLTGGADQKVEIKINVVATTLTKAFVIALNKEVRNPGERSRVQQRVMAQLGKLDIGEYLDEGSPGGKVIDLPRVGE
jgi:hypothetical protein